MLQSQRTGLVLAPRRGPCPPGLTCLQETEDHTAQEAGAHGGAGAGGGPSGLSVDERARGSPGSPSEMSLSLPGPRDNLSHGGHAPPLEAQIKVIRTGRWLGQIAWTWSEQPYVLQSAVTFP